MQLLCIITHWSVCPTFLLAIICPNFMCILCNSFAKFYEVVGDLYVRKVYRMWFVFLAIANNYQITRGVIPCIKELRERIDIMFLGSSRICNRGCIFVYGFYNDNMIWCFTIDDVLLFLFCIVTDELVSINRS